MSPSHKLLLDELLSAAIADRLRAVGVDAIAVVEDALLVGAPDSDILEAATAQRRCLVTLNIADFVVLSRQWQAAGRDCAGIVYVPSRAFPQNRSFIGSVSAELKELVDRDAVPGPNAEAFLRPGTR
ncbi:MAG TPA: DUF5615 family PIN-like protein [Jatrophihabitantaceae bacterium]|nr:DUF5615 family PIN-like protein [Jatrophihabitantaceae bacterium]